MRNVLADLRSSPRPRRCSRCGSRARYDEAHDARRGARSRRIATAVAKYWVCKRAPAHVGEALECLGGNGYVEESGMPRLYREAPLNSIWEGSGNVICLDVLRALAREPGVASRRSSPRSTRRRGADPRLDACVRRRCKRELGDSTTSSSAPAGSSSGWRSRSRARCWCATATRPSPTRSAPSRLAGDGGRALRHAARPGSTAAAIVERAPAAASREHARRTRSTGRSRASRSNRPERGNGITLAMPRELAERVERADLDPAVHVIALSGNGKGFCGGYDLVESAEGIGDAAATDAAPPGSPLDPTVDRDEPRSRAAPGTRWSTTQMMSRNVRGFMWLFHADKPVVCKVHGFCVAGGTDMALCSDLLVIADDAKIGYPPARVWGVADDALWAHRIGLERAKRLLFTGDCLSGAEARRVGPRDRGAAARRARRALRDAARAHRAACRSTSS